VSALAFAVVVSVASAGCYAVGAVVQERLAVRVPLRRASALLAYRGWWLAVALGGAGTLLHVVALRYGPLSLIQPLGALTLVLALPVGAAIVGRSVTTGQWWGAGMTTAGVAILLLLTAPVARVGTLGVAEAIAVTVVCGGVLMALVLAAIAARRVAVPRSLLFAVAAGLAFGVGSALTQTVAVRFTTAGAAGLLTPATVAVVGFAVGGFLLSQASYRGSGLGAPLAILTLVNPAAASLIGLSLLGERYAGGLPGVALAIAAAVISTWGVALLVQPSRPPRPRPASAGAGADRLGLDRPVAQRGPELLALDVHVGHDPVEPAR
jgi:uncharacterized membrane protein